MTKYILSFLLAVSVFSSNGQQIIHVFETIKDTLVEVKLNESNIVDINSRLEVTLVKDSILKKASLSSGINEELIAKLDQLSFILATQIDILNLLEEDLEGAPDSVKIAKLGQYSTLMDEFYDKVIARPEIESLMDGYYDVYWQTSSRLDRKVYPDAQTFAIKKLSEDAQDIMTMMENSDDFQNITIQLVAFINTRTEYQRKLHIENFDNYAAGEFYEVERWVTSFSDEDLKEFEKIQGQADQLNKMLDKGINNFGDLLNENFRSITCFKNLLEDLEELYKERKTLFDTDQLTQGETLMLETQSKFIAFYNTLASLEDDTNPQGTSENPLAKFNKYQDIFLDTAKSFPEKFNGISLQFDGLGGTQNPKITNFIAQAKLCIDTLKQDIEKVKNIIAVTSNMLSPFKKSAEIADEVAGKAFDFSIDDLPDRGYINLKTGGKRVNGDELEIKLRIRTKEDKEKNMPGLTLEMRTFTLQQVKIYSISKVTLILAIPFPQSNVELLNRNDVQFAPSGSLLFKFGSRKSKALNFISPGFGFNISTPDFNLDGTPDVGLGIIGTVLKDIISFGWSYNTTTNSQFWFVGLSLPVTLPGVPINNVQSKKID